MSTTMIRTRNQKKKQKIIDEDDDEQSPLALLFTEQFKDIFETHIVPKLRPKSELKFLKMAFKNARDAIERSKDRSKIVEVSNSRISFYITTKARLG